jgi:hypothetical protein
VEQPGPAHGIVLLALGVFIALATILVCLIVLVNWFGTFFLLGIVPLGLLLVVAAVLWRRPGGMWLLLGAGLGLLAFAGFFIWALSNSG